MKKIILLAFVSILLSLAVVSELPTLVVADPAEIVVPDDYEKIQWAINNASDGDTIFVRAGTYYEHVILDKPVMLIGEDKYNTIIDGNGTGTVIMVIADNVSISKFTIRNGYYGIHLKYSSGSVLRDNNMTGNTVNFIVSGYFLLRFMHDIDDSNTVDGKPVYYWINQHHRQVPSDAGYVAIVNSTNITVENLNVSKTQGVLFMHTNYSIIENVNVSSNSIGIHLIGSSNNTVRGNIATNNMQFGIYLDGLFLPLDSGGRWLLSSGNTIIGNMVSKNMEGGIRLNGRAGFYLYGGNIICRNTVTSNRYGSGFYSTSDSDIIVGNTITYNFGGINLQFSERNVIIGNTVSNNGAAAGIYLNHGSNGSMISGNTIINSGEYGIELCYSSNNSIYHNNFIDNTQQVDIEVSEHANFWDDGYPSGGNYWSDYTGTDFFSGPCQNETGSDGIGDTPYVIDAENEDKYPLMNAYTSPDIHLLYYELLADYTELQLKYDNLTTSYNSLQAGLRDLQSKYDALKNELSTTRNVMYALLATTIVFIATTAYFIVRKPKAKQD